MTDAQHNRETLIEAIRVLNDLSDCMRAVSFAGKLAAEKLEEVEGGLVNLLAFIGNEEAQS
jgi:hypothetical protein